MQSIDYLQALFQEFVNSANKNYDFQEFRNAELTSISKGTIITGNNNQDFEIYIGKELEGKPGFFEDSFLHLYKFRNAAVYLARPLVLKGEYLASEKQFFYNNSEYQVKLDIKSDLLQIKREETRFILETSTINGTKLKLNRSGAELNITSSINSISTLTKPNSTIKTSDSGRKNLLTKIKGIFTAHKKPLEANAALQKGATTDKNPSPNVKFDNMTSSNMEKTGLVTERTKKKQSQIKSEQIPTRRITRFQ